MNQTIRVGGVPEHFNAPWSMDSTTLALEQHKVKVEWTDFPGGTGAMCKALGSNEVDVALLLTEGAVVYAADHPDIALCGVYVQSPLVWGVHVGNVKSEFKSFSDLNPENCTFAISRFGSGSHLMAFVLAKQLGWDLEKHDLQFKVVGNLTGARESLQEDGTLVFMWEKFMTAPFCDMGELRRIGVCPTPWPCFVVAARREVLGRLTATGGNVLDVTMDVVRESCAQFKHGGQATVDMIMEKYGITKEGATQWLSEVEFECSKKLPHEMLQGVIDTLAKLNRFGDNAPPSVEQLCVGEIEE